MKNKTLTIFSQRLAGLLMLKGFVLVDVGTNDIDQNKRVFFFNDTEEVKNVIEDFKKHKSKYFK